MIKKVVGGIEIYCDFVVDGACAVCDHKEYCPDPVPSAEKRMTKLVRSLRGFPQRHFGPRAGGTFWALGRFNDLPSVDKEMDFEQALSLYAVYIRDARQESPAGEWVRIRSLEDLPSFSEVWRDDYEACNSYQVVRPFMPEFYLIKKENMNKCAIDGYFGCNGVIEETLPLLPVREVRVLDAALHIEMSRPLSSAEAYLFARMGQSTPTNIEDGQTVFELWWD